MSDRQSMMRLLPLLREYGGLERKRVQDGVTPLEYQRWRDLEQKLANQIFQGAEAKADERRKHVRVPTKLRVQYRTRENLKDAIVRNVSKGGLFINTPYPPAIGTTFVLIIQVDVTGDSVEVPCEVVTNNVINNPGASMKSEQLGMGVKFIGLGADQRRAVEHLFAAALGHESLEEFWGTSS
jgi:type IV pilus assembly protein PilZ